MGEAIGLENLLILPAGENCQIKIIGMDMFLEGKPMGMKTKKKINFKAVNGVLTILILGLGVVIARLAFSRDLLTVVGLKKTQDVVLKNIKEIKRYVYDGKAKIEVSPKDLFGEMWREIDITDEVIIIYPEGELVNVMNIEKKTLDKYSRKEYMEHLDSLGSIRYVLSSVSWSVSGFLKQLLERRPASEEAPTVNGCIVIPSTGGYTLISQREKVAVSCWREGILGCIYPVPKERDDVENK